MPLCVSEEEEEVLVEARRWSTSLDLSSSEGGGSSRRKKLRAFLIMFVLCLLDQLLGFLVPRWRLYEQMASIS